MNDPLCVLLPIVFGLKSTHQRWKRLETLTMRLLSAVNHARGLPLAVYTVATCPLQWTGTSRHWPLS